MNAKASQAGGLSALGAISQMVFDIRKITLPVEGMDELCAEARGEGYGFIDRLVSEWVSGINRFDAAGEVLCGCIENGRIIAVGGLNCDPFAARAEVGRIRRVYVRAQRRGCGVGEALVKRLIGEARNRFMVIRLRAVNPRAAKFYERLGFEPLKDANATHSLILSRPAD